MIPVTQSAILYEGRSALDSNVNIVAIATGIGKSSRNSKTGDMIQIWILRQDVAPQEATKTGADAAICGDCMHRPSNQGSCYVLVHNAPRAIWQAWQDGQYHYLSDYSLLSRKPVRLGAYGDPLALPFSTLRALTQAATRGFTGYTHQWSRFTVSAAPEVMASVDSETEREHAKALGYRTFRVRRPSDPLMEGEIECPASEEAGHKTVCARCKLCAGTTSRARVDVSIVAHGAKAKRFFA